MPSKVSIPLGHAIQGYLLNIIIISFFQKLLTVLHHLQNLLAWHSRLAHSLPIHISSLISESPQLYAFSLTHHTVSCHSTFVDVLPCVCPSPFPYPVFSTPSNVYTHIHTHTQSKGRPNLMLLTLEPFVVSSSSTHSFLGAHLIF